MFDILDPSTVNILFILTAICFIITLFITRSKAKKIQYITRGIYLGIFMILTVCDLISMGLI